MGSFCSKVPLFFENENCQFEKMDGSERVKSTEDTGQTDAYETNEGKSVRGTTNQEGHCSFSCSFLHQSIFSPLEKKILKGPKGEKNQPKYVMKYNNGRYLKCYQHMAPTIDKLSELD